MRVYLLLLSIAITLISCSSETPKSWIVTGHLIKMQPDSLEQGSVDTTNLRTGTALDEIAELDLSTASVSVKQRVTSDAGETTTIELASGKFEDKSVIMRGNIDELTEVEITIELDSDNVMTTTAMIGPGSNVSFALIDSSEPDLDRVVLYGVSNRATDPEKKFVISGDLQDIVGGDQLAIVDFTTEIWDEDGEWGSKEFGEVLIRNGRFHIEADVDEPTVVDIYVEIVGDQFTHFGSAAVVEPKSTVEVSPLKSSSDLMTSSNSELHTMLIESWLQNEEYQTKMVRSESLRKEFHAEWKARQAETKYPVEDVGDQESSEEDDIVLLAKYGNK